MASHLFRGLARNGPLWCRTPSTRWKRSISLTTTLRGIPAVKLTMPALSPTMEVGKIVKWHKKEGEAFSAGDALCDIETDKATLSMDALDDGVMAKILVEEGTDNIEISSLIALTVEEGEDYTQVEVPTDFGAGKAEAPQSVDRKGRQPESVAAAASRMIEPTSLPLSPSVKRLIAEHHLDASKISPSGIHGRLLKGDVLSYLSGEQSELAPPLRTDDASVPAQLPAPPVPLPKPPPAVSLSSVSPQFEDIPNSSMRRTIAKRLVQAKSTIPHTYAAVDCEMDNVLSLRREWKADKKVTLSVNDFVVKAVAVALRLVPSVNANWTHSGPQFLQDVDVSVAVATATGLITPIVRGADKLTVAEISSAIRMLASRARDGKLQPQEFQGGSFCISNLGMYGVTNFSAVVNPPQVCILAVGSTQRVPSTRNGITNITTVTLSCDARLINEQTAGDFLAAFKRCIENPSAGGLLY